MLPDKIKIIGEEKYKVTIYGWLKVWTGPYFYIHYFYIDVDEFVWVKNS